MKHKNPAAVKLAELSRRSRMKNKTAKQRQEQARRAVQIRWAKAKGTPPRRWYGLFAVDEPEHPDALAWFPSRDEALAAARSPEFAGRVGFIDWVEYNPQPSGLRIVDEFEGDDTAHLEAMRIADTIPEPKQ